MFSFLQYNPLRKLLRNAVFFLISAILCFNTFAPLPRTEPTVKNKDTGDFFLPDYGGTHVAAHRMGKSLGPDNTMLALKKCLESSTPPDVIESDVQITKDGELVLYHDLFLEKRSNSEEVFGRKHVTTFSKTYAELRLLWGDKGENICCGGFDSGLFDAILASGSTKTVFCGHDHTNNFGVEYQGVVLTYIQQSGYGTGGLLKKDIPESDWWQGYTRLTLADDGTFTHEQFRNNAVAG